MVWMEADVSSFPHPSEGRKHLEIIHSSLSTAGRAYPQVKTSTITVWIFISVPHPVAFLASLACWRSDSNFLLVLLNQSVLAHSSFLVRFAGHPGWALFLKTGTRKSACSFRWSSLRFQGPRVAHWVNRHIKSAIGPLTVTLSALFLFTLRDLSKALSGAPQRCALPCTAAIFIIMVLVLPVYSQLRAPLCWYCIK